MSVKSSSSFGSAALTDASEDRISEPDQTNRDEDDIDVELDKEALLFGALHEDKLTTWMYASTRLSLECLQLFLLIVSPRNGWHIDEENSWWRAFSFVTLRHTVEARGYFFFLVCFYVWIVILMTVAGLLAWTGWGARTHNLPPNWLLWGLHRFKQGLLQILDMTCLTLLLLPLECGYFGVPDDMKGRLRALPDIQCWAMPHLIHAGASVYGALLFLVLSGCFNMHCMQTNVLSKVPWGVAHTKIELMQWGTKMFMVMTSIFVSSLPWMSVLMFMGGFLLAYLHIRFIPYQLETMNYLRGGTYSVVAWAGFMYVLNTYLPMNSSTPDSMSLAITIAMWAGCIPVACLGVAAAYWRVDTMVVKVAIKFRDAPADMKPHRIHRFASSWEVENAARCCRKWVDDDTLDDEAVATHDRILHAGIKMFPSDAYMQLLYAGSLIDVQGAYNVGHAQLKEVRRKGDLSVVERYMAYVRDNEHAKKMMMAEITSANGSTGTAMELASYVEHQRKLKIIQRCHLNALYARRAFWQALQARNVDFSKLVSKIQSYEEATRAAEKSYKQALFNSSYKSAELLSWYVKYLTGVRGDPWTASFFEAELDKIQRQEEDNSHKLLMQEEGSNVYGHGAKGAIVMGGNSLIKLVNDAAIQALGYDNKADMIGKNITMIIPPPFSTHHNEYVSRYLETGQAHILGGTRELIAIHRSGYVLPMSVCINKLAGVGEDTSFMAIFEPLPPEADTACIWTMTTGLVISCDASFTDWFGYGHGEVHGKELASLVTQSEELSTVLAQVKSSMALGSDAKVPTDMSDGRDVPSSWAISCLQVRHLYLDEVRSVACEITTTGFGASAIFKVKMRREPGMPSPLLLVTDNKGHVVHVTSRLAEKLGTTTSVLQGRQSHTALDSMLPPPFVRLHRQWVKERQETIPPYSCMSGLTVCMNGPGGRIMPVRIDMKRKVFSASQSSIVSVLEDRTYEQLLDERRVSLIVDKRGVVQSCSESPHSLFNLDFAAMIGGHLSYIVDVLQPRIAQSEGTPEASHIMLEEERAAAVINTMAEKSYAHPGMSWRVGVLPIMDPVSLVQLGSVGQAMIMKKKVPAVMTVAAFLPEATLDGAKLMLPPELLFKVELWRSDLLTCVLEVNPGGVIDKCIIKDQPVYDPQLLLGLPSNLLQGAPLSHLLPVGKNAHMEMLLTDGSFAKHHRGAGQQAGGAMAVRSAMRTGLGHLARRRGVGPQHVITIQHGTDRSDLDLTVQAVMKSNVGHGNSLYVIIHVSQPKCGRDVFDQWIRVQPPPTLPFAPATSRVGSTGAGNALSGKSRKAGNEGGASRAHSRRASLALSNLDPVQESALLLAPYVAPDGEGIHLQDAGRARFPLGSASEVNPETDMSAWLQLTTGADDAHAHDLDVQQMDAPKRSAVFAEGTLHRSRGDGYDHHDAAAAAGDDDGSEEDADEGNDDDEGQHAGMGEDNEEDAQGADDQARSMQELKRGKRLKKLTKIILGPQAVAPAVRLKYTSYALVTMLVLVDIIMFVVFKFRLDIQRQQVADLRSTGEAINSAMKYSHDCSSIITLLAGLGDPSIPHLGKGDIPQSMDELTEEMDRHIKEVAMLQHGIYRGFHQIRELPTAYGLKDIWEKPEIPIVYFYHSNGTTIHETILTSLWDAAGMFVKSGNQVVQNWKTLYGTIPGTGPAMMNDTDVMFMLYNMPREMMFAYFKTLDGLMRKAVDDSENLNQIQLIILAVEGIVIGTLSVAIMWYYATRAIEQRYNVLCAFMVVPAGIVRTLGTEVVNVNGQGESREVDDQDVDMPLVTENGQHDFFDPEAPLPVNAKAGGPASSAKVNLLANANSQQTDGKVAAVGFFATLKATLQDLGLMQAKSSLPGAKRALGRSPMFVLAYIWPFLLWMILVILLNLIGYVNLLGMSTPISLANLVQFSNLHMNRLLLFSIRYMGRQYWTPDLSGVAPIDMTDTTYNPLSATMHGMISQEYKDLRLEYDAMLYGGSAPSVAAQSTEPHFALATKGVIFTDGADLMYATNECLAEDPADCLAPDHPYYRYTTHGLDQAVKQFFLSIEGILVATPSEISVSNDNFKYVFQVGSGYIAGGFNRLADLYASYVDNIYADAELKHIAALALVIGLSVIYIFLVQRPTETRVRSESRCVAQLMNCLPAEIDVSTLLTQVVAPNQKQEKGGRGSTVYAR